MVCVAAAAISTHEHSSVPICLSCPSAQVQSADVLPRAARGALGHALRSWPYRASLPFLYAAAALKVNA